ncbi:Mitochondrial ribosome small subunit bioproteinsis protein [Purpureocillium takamizusanense]|uniref:Mitochondrial ribosome small subunit bioproteinsis protein n=1 Tax=Purpureocillium takamizusanense TaxID=2060973 RepID=A0A9Q8QJ22_9HYPO|nr:Mitochondrial ribosome small subunit biogenesis protein [Purpureocillium takamizusanense]UNI20081.1 Mitochondrial ribosome small subunit bioproteinsis protein [Purpureocillium takamizusanense]
MHRAAAARWLNRALRIGDTGSFTRLPVYLCPALRFPDCGALSRERRAPPYKSAATQCRMNHTEVIASEHVSATPPTETPTLPARKLPVTCSGCGAFTQTDDPQQFGYYNPDSKRVRTWLRPKVSDRRVEEAEEDKIVDEALKNVDSKLLEELGLNTTAMVSGEAAQEVAAAALTSAQPPVCDRCHNLIHHSTTSDTAKLTMYHPTVESLRETIEESPHKYNHIYHVIDAADFPMSLIPRLNVLLGDIPLRSRNRRSRSDKYQHDRKTEMSFIVTRGDLLAPTKEMVDGLMPYLREVLREALGRLGQRVRLGNTKCVSAKRSWWTKTVKEDIWKRGGAGWMVGKVNVGKSQLFEAVYPKGRVTEAQQGNSAAGATRSGDTTSGGPVADEVTRPDEVWADLNVGELLPPAQPAQNYPAMPVVSSLPGTTASPIRVPFGNGKGELIDLPGLARSDLELFVKEEHRQSLIMKNRIVPEQISVKSGKSLILGGGLIRITPSTPDMIFLMYNFTPIKEHLTSTEKAVEFQKQTRQSIGVETIALPEAAERTKLAGKFRLCHDVTKKRAGPLTRKSAVGLQVDRLPFRVLSTDILIEGVGYVEIVAQVRTRDFERWSAMQDAVDRHAQKGEEARGESEDGSPAASDDPFAELTRDRRDDSGGEPVRATARPRPPKPDWPSVDVYTPEGRFVGSRVPIHGWLNNKPRVLPKHKKSRPRRSMKGEKKKEKKERRGAAGMGATE